MTTGGERACGVLGFVAPIILFIGMWPLQGFLPPLKPSLTPAEVSAVFREHSTGIIVGSIFIMLGSTLLLALFCAVAARLDRIGARARVWSQTLVCATAFGLVFFFLSAAIFSVAAYRPERADEAIQLVADIGFMVLVIPAFPATLQAFAIAFAILGDKANATGWPRWVAYANFWVGIAFLPGCVIALFKSGPFAWNGVLAFWLAAVMFGLWLNLMGWMLLNRQPAHAAAA